MQEEKERIETASCELYLGLEGLFSAVSFCTAFCLSRAFNGKFGTAAKLAKSGENLQAR